jgi:hypothetical protein
VAPIRTPEIKIVDGKRKMKMRFDRKYHAIAFGVILSAIVMLAAASAANAQTEAFGTGDEVEVLWSGTWYKAKVLETKSGQYKIHYEGWSNSFDEWVRPTRMRRVPGYSSDARTKWGPRDAYRSGYSVGDKVYFSVSGKSADFQPCVVAENKPEEVMRVKCNAFRDWVAGVYIVHSEGTLRREPPGLDDETTPASRPKQKNTGNSTGLKIGEYACTGSGGRMMIGLGFKVLSGNRYTDLDGKSRGTFSIAGGKITFRGGHLAGTTGRDLKDNWFTVGAQASCGPF